MFISNHYLTTFIAGQALGMTPAECAIGSAGAAVNDIVPTLDYWIRLVLKKHASKWGKVYEHFHDFHWWMMGFAVLILVFSAFNINTNILFLFSFGYTAHIAIDKMWHYPSPRGGYREWGVGADVVVATACVVVLKDEILKLIMTFF